MNFRVSFSILLLAVAQAAGAQADFTVTHDPAGPPLLGFGVQMNPYLRCAPNRADVEPRIADYESKVLALRPQHVRIFYRQEWFDGGADDIARGEPPFRVADSFIKQCRLAERAGAKINITAWRGPWPEPEKQMAAFATTLESLLRDQALTAIRFVTVQNEPNTTKINFDTYNRLYRALDAELKKRRIHELISIISGDLVQNDQQAWFENLGSDLADLSDGYSIHVYWDYWDTPKLVRRISEVPRIVASLPPAQQRPLFVTEFGVRGRRDKPTEEPGNHDDGTPIASTTVQAMQLAWFQMEALNRGYAATAIWTLEDAWYDRFMPYGVIGAAKDGFPLKPAYHMLRLFTHTIEPWWRAMKVEGAADGCIVAAAGGENGELTVLALNRSEVQREISITISTARPLHVLTWNRDGQDGIEHFDFVEPQPEPYRVTLSPRRLTVLTTQEFLK